MCCRLERREFLGLTATGVAGAYLMPAAALAAGAGADWPAGLWDPSRSFHNVGKPLKVQPVLMYQLPRRKEATSWKSWGGIQTEAAVGEEVNRITRELNALSAEAEFPMQVLPVAKVTSIEEGSRVRNPEADLMIVYPATGSGNMLRACAGEMRWAIIFVWDRSGPGN